MPDGPSPRHSVSVAAAIFDDSGQHVLLIKRRDNGRWEPPGGVLELEESVAEGLRREVREETGAEIAIDALTGIYKNIRTGVVALVFRSRVMTPCLADSEEASEIAWKPLSFITEALSDPFAVRIVDAIHPQGPHVRSHDGTKLLDADFRTT